MYYIDIFSPVCVIKVAKEEKRYYFLSSHYPLGKEVCTFVGWGRFLLFVFI